MKRVLTGLAVVLLASQAHAQQPIYGQPIYSQPPRSVVIYEHPVQGKPAEVAPQPKPVPAPAVKAEECKVNICVIEPKKNTKTVYTSRCKDYCVRLCSLFGGGHGGCGDCTTECDQCEKRTKNVLVKKTVPACDTTQCVLKEVPAPVVPCIPCPPCPPCPPYIK